MTDSILLQSLSVEELSILMGKVFKTHLEDFKKEINSQAQNDDLMTRQEVLGLLKINASTLWHWQNKGRITVFKYANKCYYKRSELLAGLITKK